MAACNCCASPICAAPVFLIDPGEPGTGNDETSESAALAEAHANNNFSGTFAEGTPYVARNAFQLSDESWDAVSGRSRWRLSIPRSATCYMKIWIRRIFTPEGGEPEETDEAEYTWQAASVSDCRDRWNEDGTPKPFVTAQLGELALTEKGTATLALRYSCLAGYDARTGSDGFP